MLAGLSSAVTLLCQPAIVRKYGPISRQAREIALAEEEAARQAELDALNEEPCDFFYEDCYYEEQEVVEEEAEDQYY